MCFLRLTLVTRSFNRPRYFRPWAFMPSEQRENPRLFVMEFALLDFCIPKQRNARTPLRRLRFLNFLPWHLSWEGGVLELALAQKGSKSENVGGDYQENMTACGLYLMMLYTTLYTALVIARTNRRQAKRKTLALQGFSVEVAGFEPAAFWSRTKRATKLRYTSAKKLEPIRGLEPLTC